MKNKKLINRTAQSAVDEFFIYQENSTFCTNFPAKQKKPRADATRCMGNMVAMGSLHPAREPGDF